jgi:2,4-dienoyl-CoA reductase-like NADH-dependent reductase (Old Yellow Enzyme family)
LTRSEIKDFHRAYAEAASRAPEAGIGKLEMHFADGHHGVSFFSPLANNRTDDCGGNLKIGCASITKPWTPSATVWPER